MSRIKTETGTSIIIPPDTEKNDCIRIEGDPMGVRAAKNMLLELAAKMVCVYVYVCTHIVVCLFVCLFDGAKASL